MAYESDFLHNGWVGGTIYYSFDLSETWRFAHPLNPINGGDGLGALSTHWQERFQAAMDEWEAVANVRFIETTTPDADLVIGWHSLDGPGGTVGNAWGWDRDGDGRYERSDHDGYVVRMDPDDTHAFFENAVHELGHVLGLGDIEHMPSIMAPTVTETAPTAYDVHLIQDLYGPPDSSLLVGLEAVQLRRPNPDRVILGTDGDDRVIGTRKADEIHGGNGDDSLVGSGGNDTLFGNVGEDLLSGQEGDDLIFGGQNAGPLRLASDGSMRHLDGVDTLVGGDGNDTLCGQYGNDILYGGYGFDADSDEDDALFGGQNDDTLWGLDGDDVLAGNRGDDSLVGGDGNDRYYFGHNSGNDTIDEWFEEIIDEDNRNLIYIQKDVNGSGIRNSHDVLARMSDNADGQAVIDLGAGNSITMSLHETGWFVASDFIIYG